MLNVCGRRKSELFRRLLVRKDVDIAQALMYP